MSFVCSEVCGASGRGGCLIGTIIPSQFLRLENVSFHSPYHVIPMFVDVLF